MNDPTERIHSHKSTNNSEESIETNGKRALNLKSAQVIL